MVKFRFTLYRRVILAIYCLTVEVHRTRPAALCHDPALIIFSLLLKTTWQRMPVPMAVKVPIVLPPCTITFPMFCMNSLPAYTIHKVCSVQCAVCSVKFAVCGVPCALCNAVYHVIGGRSVTKGVPPASLLLHCHQVRYSTFTGQA